ncbi:hypothetical protein AX17_003215 [Amanita inopinata Kibby_2008]|nr:hypothetical protein AX17_003215 [Amanita inopinata Kibby_2008]
MQSAADDNPRPSKRQRLDSTSEPIQNTVNVENLNSIPPANLLISLPSLLIHPPTHRHHQFSLLLSSSALRKGLTLPDIDADLECRAWAALAEVGIIHGMEEFVTAAEVEKAIAKALLIAQKHPSLRLYKPHLSFLSAKVAYSHQHNPKHATHTIRRLLASLPPSDPPHLVYTAYLASITYSEKESTTKVLHAVQNLQNLASDSGHHDIVLLAQVIRLRLLLKEGLWQTIEDALKDTEQALQLNFEVASDHSPPENQESPVEMALRLHVLIMGVTFYTYAGEAVNTASRLTKLHELLDSGALSSLGASGIVEFPLPGHRPLYVQMTHPRVLYLLAFLVSSVSKRNPVGRKPKRKVFANEGLNITERELRKELALPQWTSQQEAKDLYDRLHKLKADLICELVANSICRNEFDDAERNLDDLIAHTRTTSLFPMFAARISLHHAHLAHALGQTTRALECYRLAAHLSRPRTANNIEDPFITSPRTSPTKKSSISPVKRKSLSPKKKSTPSPKKSPRKRSLSTRQKEEVVEVVEDDDDQYPEDTWVHASARTGELWIRIGMLRQRDKSDTLGGSTREEFEQLCREGELITRECEGLGGTLKAIGEVLKASLANEILKSKSHLRRALDLATAAQDNHVRALILALISSHYFHTARDHAQNMLHTCEQLAAGLGAQPRSTSISQTSGKQPLVRSDNINVDRKDDAGTDDANLSGASKPGSKRKTSLEVGEVENCNPGSRPLKKGRSSFGESGSWDGDGVGNAQLRLWVGERFLELSRWAGDDQSVKRQEIVNQRLEDAVRSIEERGKAVDVC